MKRLAVAVLWGVMAVMPTMALADFSDDFEDGVIDSSLWNVGGGTRGSGTYDPIGTGTWSYSLAEVTGSDGYLRARVWGPQSGGTYGAEAWIRTTYNFNDGKDYTVNFTWEPAFVDPHFNEYFIQVTDGYIPEIGDFHWPQRRPPLPPITDADLAGTNDLVSDPYNLGPGLGFSYRPGIGKVSWSIDLDSTGIAGLYSSPDASGCLLGEATLDPTKPWYIRFMVLDGTSGGFPAGDASLNLYDFEAIVVPLPATFVLGAVGLGMAGWLTPRMNLRRSQ
ncbi:MAG: hypothetical protein MUC88_05835 [Planctomycetes bacterium]|nr:hypothetical protein [Planctomycetota bacterium]